MTKAKSEGAEGATEGRARVAWTVKAPPMPGGEESMVQVYSLIGPSKGTVVDMPYSAAQSAVAMGTARRVEGVHYGPNFPGTDPTTPEPSGAASKAAEGDDDSGEKDSKAAGKSAGAKSTTRKK